jgi:hypothetical protein
LVDPTGLYIKEAIFPSLPAVFQDSIAYIPLAVPYTGTCAQAICTGTSVISNDILADTHFDKKWRDLCLRCGIKALQSTPIRKGEGAPEGTFVIAYKQPASSDESWNYTLMADFAELAYDAIPLHRRTSAKGRLG